MLFYLVKHLHPDLANVTRELSKANDGTNPVAYKKLLHVIKYVIDMKNLGLKIEPTGNSNNPWESVWFSNSDYAGDPVRRQSISSFVLYVIGVPVSWQSEMQKSVSLSSSEAEYIVLSEAVKEVIYVVQLLGSMKILVKYPVMVRVDNIGAIFVASNITTKCCTKHVEIWYKCMNVHADDRFVKIVFVKSADNDWDVSQKT